MTSTEFASNFGLPTYLTFCKNIKGSGLDSDVIDNTIKNLLRMKNKDSEYSNAPKKMHEFNIGYNLEVIGPKHTLLKDSAGNNIVVKYFASKFYKTNDAYNDFKQAAIDNRLETAEFFTNHEAKALANFEVALQKNNVAYTISSENEDLCTAIDYDSFSKVECLSGECPIYGAATENSEL